MAATAPADGAANVAAGATIAISFSREPDPDWISSANIVITPAVSGSWAVNGTTATFTPGQPLRPSTKYTVQLSPGIRGKDGAPLFASTFSFTTAAGADTTPPAAVYDLSSSALTSTGVQLSWTATGNDGKTGTATTYELRYQAGAACPLTVAGFSQGTRVATGEPHVAGTAESVAVTGLAAKTKYCFGLRVLDAAANASDLSNQVTVTTPDSTPPAAPALAATPIDGGTIRLDWTAVGDDGNTGTAAAYELRYASGTACPLTPATFATGLLVSLNAPQAPGAAETTLVTRLISDTPYCFLLKVSDAAGNFAFSNAARASTPDVVPPASASLSLGTVGATSVQLNWIAVGDDGNTGTASSQQLRYLSGASCPVTAANFSSGTLVATSAPAAAGTPQSATAAGLTMDVDYCFALKVVDDFGNSSLSSSLAAHTPDVIAPAPAVLTAGAIAPNDIRVNWLDVGDDGNTGTATSQVLYQQSGAACATFSSTNLTGATTVTGVAAPRVAGTADGVDALVAADTDYCFLLKAVDNAGNASYSNVLTAHSQDIVPPGNAVLAVAPGTLRTYGASITWTAQADNGSTGAPARSQELRYQTGAACASYSSANFATGTNAYGAAPLSPGLTETAMVTGLSADTDYCFLLRIGDEVPNYSYSNLLSVHTVDNLPPGKPVLTAGTIGPSSIQVTWTEVAENGVTDAGTLASNDLRYDLTCPTIANNDFTSGNSVTLTPNVTDPGTSRSAAASALIADTSYCFILRSADENGNVSFSDPLILATQDNVPPGKPQLSAGATTAGSIEIKWTEVAENGVTDAGTLAGNTLQYDVTCPSIANGAFTSGQSWPLSPIALPPGTARSVVITGLAADTSYCFTLRSSDENGNTSFSDSITVNTVDNVAPATPVLAAGTITANSIQVTWTEVGDHDMTGMLTSDELRVGTSCPTVDSTGAFTSGTVVPQAGAIGNPGGPRAETATGLNQNTDYCFVLVSADENGNFAVSAGLTLHTPKSDATAPAAISDLKLGITGSTTITMRWTAPADPDDAHAASYEIRTATGASCPITEGTFSSATLIAQSLVPQAGGASDNLDATVADTGTDALCVAIKSQDAAANVSAISNVPVPPARVSDLAAGIATDFAVPFSWTAVGDHFQTGTAFRYRMLWSPYAGACPAEPLAITTAPGVQALTLAQSPMPVTTPESTSISGLVPGTHYCFTLAVFDDNGADYSLSPVVSAVTTDTTPPDAPLGLTVAQPFVTSLHLQFKASGDNGSTGAAASYELSYLAGTGCATGFDYNGNGNTRLNVPIGSPAPLAGTVIDYTLAGLPKGGHVCIEVTATDANGNHSAPSALLEADTSPDITAPAAISINAPSAANINSSSVALSWTAVADDGVDASSGKVTSYTARFVSGVGSDCSALAAADYSTASAFAQQPTPAAAPGLLETVTLTFPTNSNQPACVAVTATDAAGNHSAVSNWVYVKDTTPPNAVSDLAASNVTLGSALIQFTETGDNGSAGAVASNVLRWSKGFCPAFDFSSAQSSLSIAGHHAGYQASQTIETLDYSTTYCFGLEEKDGTGNTSALSNTVQITTPDPNTSSEIGSLRAAIENGNTLDATLGLHAAIVTYTKAAVGGAAAGTPDGAGFFVQKAANGPALYVAIDPSTFAGGVSPGTSIDIVPSAGSVLANGTVALTAATGTARFTGATLPAATDVSALTATSWPLPIAAGDWAYDGQLIATTGRVGAFVDQGNGFSEAPVTTAGVPAGDPNLSVRVPNALATFGGKVARITAPGWRDGGAVLISAWAAGDIDLGPAISATTPADGAVDVDTSITGITITFDKAMDPATLTAHAGAGTSACSGNVELAIDGTFANCVDFTTAAPAMSANNTVATYTFAAPLAAGTRYKLWVTSSALSADGLPMGASGKLTNGFETIPVAGAVCTSKQIAISQVAGGANGFVELHNRSGKTLSLSNAAIHYADAAGTTWQRFPLSGSIAPGQYFLIAAGPVNGVTPDVTAALPLDPVHGKVALSFVAGVTFSTACPGSNALDFVGYGNPSDANGCALGGNGLQTSPLSAGNAAIRGELGCADTQQNYIDFTIGAAAPRNTSSTPNGCSCSGGSNPYQQYVNYCVVQYPNPNHSYTGPYPLTASPGATVPSNAQTGVSFIYGQIYQGGQTGTGSARANIHAQVGVGRSGEDPTTQYVWYDAAFNLSTNNNDEYQAAIPAPLAPGNYQIFYRFSVDSGGPDFWTYCDLSGNGTNPGLPAFNPTNGLQLTVQ